MIGLSNFSTIFRRELAAYFNAAIAYIFIIVFVLLNGGLFMSQFFLVGRADMRSFFVTLPFTLAVFIPAVTMRLWAEEKRGNTLELLLTFPMGCHELVLGKLVASFVFYLVALLSTAPIPIMLAFLGVPDMGAILGGYIGAAFLGLFFLSIGIFISGLVRDQIVAFILALMVCFGLHLMGSEFIAMSIDGWLPGFGSFLRKFVGSAAHFQSFTRGVVDNRDLFYFLLGSGIFLVLNGFWLEGRMRPGSKAMFSMAALISAGIFLMSNWIFLDMPLGRVDLTSGRMHTISKATKEILQKLEAPVTAKFYVSDAEKMPTGMKTLEQEVVDKLNELRLASNGRFQYKIFHMEATNIAGRPGAEGKEESLEQKLQRKGVAPFQVQSIEADEVGVKLVYSSISLAYKEKPEEILPRIMPVNLSELEYMLVSKIYRMTLDHQPVISIYAPYEQRQVDPALMGLLAQLGQSPPSSMRDDKYELLEKALVYEGYYAERIDFNEDDGIPEETNALVVAEPAGLSERQLYELNRFLHGGGSLLLAVQNYEFDYDASGGRLQIFPTRKDPNINPLISAYGVEVGEGMLLDEQSEVISLSGGAQLGPFAVSVPVKLPIQIVVGPEQMNRDVSITSRLSSLFYLWGSALNIDEAKLKELKLKSDILLTSSSEAGTMPYMGGPLSPRFFTLPPENRMSKLPLAVFVQGQFPDIYSGKEVPAWQEPPPAAPGEPAAEPQAEVLSAVSPAPGKMILIGAATIFQKQMFQTGGHINFFLNSIDALTLGDELVTIRSKQPIDRSIRRVSGPEKIMWRFFATLFVPLILAAAGIFRITFRGRARQKHLKGLVAKQ